MLATTHTTLTQHEWAAVSVALSDARGCGCAAEAANASSGPLGRLSTFVFGRRKPTPLADPRLEAVRRFVCASYRRRPEAAELAAPLADHGFSAAQIDALHVLSR